MKFANSEMPDWMARIKAEQDAERDRAEAAFKDRALLDALMQTEEPRNIWKRLKNELDSISKISSKTIGVNIAVRDASSTVEEGVQISASLSGRIGELQSLYTNVFFAPRERRIRCLNQAQEEPFFFDFCTFRASLALCFENSAISPEEGASKISEHLVSILRSPMY